MQVIISVENDGVSSPELDSRRAPCPVEPCAVSRGPPVIVLRPPVPSRMIRSLREVARANNGTRTRSNVSENTTECVLRCPVGTRAEW